jgi:hypothetical protein
MTGRPEVERVQTGVRLEKRMVKVLKATAALYDVSLGELIEDLVNDAFAGRRPFADLALAQIAELSRIYGLDHGELSPPVLGPPAPEGE